MTKKIEFTVIKTNIADEDGKKVMIGGKVLLGKTLAKHYKKLGYIEMPMPDFDDATADIEIKEEKPDADKDATAGSTSDEPKAEDSPEPAPKRRRL